MTADQGLAGDTVITMVIPCGELRRRSIQELHEHWHFGVQDRLPVSKGGVTWHKKAGKWRAQVRLKGETHHLGLFEDREAAEAAVLEFRARNPSTRRRLLQSVRRNHVRCYDERALLAERTHVVDVARSGVTPVLRLSTSSGRELRCGMRH